MNKENENFKFIGAYDENVSYMGRVDFSHKDFAVMYWVGSCAILRFKGTHAGAVINNHKIYNKNFLGCIIDGKETRIEIADNNGQELITLAENLPDTEHEIKLVKVQAACNYLDFYGFAINNNGEVLPAKALPEFKIEVYGDSVCAGEVCDAVDFVASTDPEDHDGIYDNVLHAFPWLLAEKMNAALHDIAQGGIAVLDGTGYFNAPDYIGMETVYDKLCYMPQAYDGMTKWNFSEYTPDWVIFEVGQNDHFVCGDTAPIDDVKYRTKWKKAYKKIIKSLRKKYPDARITLLLTVLNHAETWDNALDEITEELNDDKISHFMFKRTGSATPGHPRIPEHREMADELYDIAVKEFFKEVE